MGEPPDTRSVGDPGRKWGGGGGGGEKGETGGLILVHLWKVIPRAPRIWGALISALLALVNNNPGRGRRHGVREKNTEEEEDGRGGRGGALLACGGLAGEQEEPKVFEVYTDLLAS